MAKEKRFIKVYSQGAGSTEIWVDSETGVNYLFRSSGYAGGLTVLVNSEGAKHRTGLQGKRRAQGETITKCLQRIGKNLLTF